MCAFAGIELPGRRDEESYRKSATHLSHLRPISRPRTDLQINAALWFPRNLQTALRGLGFINLAHHPAVT
jgi:hypothetical protein